MLGIEEARNLPAHKATVGGSRRKSRTVDVVTIERLGRDDCIERWRQMFGVAPPKYTSLEFMRKVIAYEVQVKAFGGHSNAIQRALKASLKAVRSEVETGRAANGGDCAGISDATGSYAEPEGTVVRTAPNAHQTIHCHNNSAPDACDQNSIMSADSTTQIGITKTNGEAETRTTASPKPTRSFKPLVLSIRAGTHLVREWNGRTYQVEALEKGFRLDGKTYRSLSAIAKKITGAHRSGPRFFGLES